MWGILSVMCWREGKTKRKLRWKSRFGSHPVRLSYLNLPRISLTAFGGAGLYVLREARLRA